MRELATIRSASVYRVADRLVLCPQLLTKAGFFLAGPPAAFDWPIGREAMIGAIEEALAASGRIMATPHRDAFDFGPVVAAAGLKSHKAFMARAVLVDVTLEKDILHVLPMVNHGARRGFEGSGEERRFEADDLEGAVDHLLALLENASTEVDLG
ncbi:hypothetical protein [Sphingopyxis sp. JAI128]|uniref:hypothetical protein n=1 Tax=Sphingopyxis sp. JAI128 TaxID=2723066 RepID=UPI00160AA0F1|nr:hypothetical protein [Sphingopyxis sp. JAI128]MBB6426970.1 hypothetical protein [Sphingopyxis sp. JAI128]